MDRVSTNLPNDSMQFYLRERQDMMLRTQSQIASQSRIEELRDDPIAAELVSFEASSAAREILWSGRTQSMSMGRCPTRISSGLISRMACGFGSASALIVASKVAAT